jgi:uncharacterized membrane protein YagU involved in acid resistance
VDLKDRLTRGLLAGILAGLVTFPWGLASKYILKTADILYMDFAAIHIYGKRPENLAEMAFAQLAVFGLFGVCGILFVYLIPYITSMNLKLKGLLWGAIIWFSTYSITILFKVPGLEYISLLNSISNLIGALIWGLALAIALEYLDTKAKQTNR